MRDVVALTKQPNLSLLTRHDWLSHQTHPIPILMKAAQIVRNVQTVEFNLPLLLVSSVKNLCILPTNKCKSLESLAPVDQVLYHFLCRIGAYTPQRVVYPSKIRAVLRPLQTILLEYHEYDHHDIFRGPFIILGQS